MNTALSTPSKASLKLTAFDYLYRDAGNFKAFGTVILSGVVSEEARNRILETMESEEFFVAEQVLLPALYEKVWGTGGKTSSDHPWHSFSQFRTVEDKCDEPLLIWDTAENFLATFERVEVWDTSLSPNHGTGFE